MNNYIDEFKVLGNQVMDFMPGTELEKRIQEGRLNSDEIKKIYSDIIIIGSKYQTLFRKINDIWQKEYDEKSKENKEEVDLIEKPPILIAAQMAEHDLGSLEDVLDRYNLFKELGVDPTELMDGPIREKTKYVKVGSLRKIFAGASEIATGDINSYFIPVNCRDTRDFIELGLNKSIQEYDCKINQISGMQAIMLLNLVKNSHDAIDRAKGEELDYDFEKDIRVKIYRKEGFDYIEVKDNGLGMPPETISKAHTNFSSKGKEGGLGFQLIREATRNYGGAFNIKSHYVENRELFNDVKTGTKIIIKTPTHPYFLNN